MRDINRIDRICDKIKELWKFYPDQRFAQLFINYIARRDSEFFYQEDNISEKNIDEQIKFTKDLLAHKDEIAISQESEPVIEYINGLVLKF